MNDVLASEGVESVKPDEAPLAVDTGFGNDSLSSGPGIMKLGFWSEIDGGEGV